MFRKSEARNLILRATVFFLSAFASCSGFANGLAPHRAIYDLELSSASERSGIDGMFGRMVYEFKGSECAGYESTFRFVTEVNMDGDQRINDQRTTTFEDLKSGVFRFETKSYTGETLNQEVSGEALHAANGVDVNLDMPEPRDLKLAESRFPTEHMKDVIAHAKSGAHFFQTRIFDGSEDGDKTLFATAVIGKKQSTSLNGSDSDAAAAGSLGNEPFWPVNIAYFNDGNAGDDMLPIYRMSFKLYENGISRNLTLDYGDFVLSGKLKDLELFSPEKCE